MARTLIPSRRQWDRWSLPSKLTALGALIGAVGLVIFAFQEVGSCVGRRAQSRQESAHLLQTQRDDEYRVHMRQYAEKSRQFGETAAEIARLLRRHPRRQEVIRDQWMWIHNYLYHWIRFADYAGIHFEAIGSPTLEDKQLNESSINEFLAALNSTGNELRALGVDVDTVLAEVEAKDIHAGGPYALPLPDHRLQGPQREALLGRGR